MSFFSCLDCFNFFFFFFFDIFKIFIYFLYSRFLLVIYFIRIGVYMSIPISQFIPPPSPQQLLLSSVCVCMCMSVSVPESESLFLFLVLLKEGHVNVSGWYVLLSLTVICFFKLRWIFGNWKKESSLKTAQDGWILYK